MTSEITETTQQQDGAGADRTGRDQADLTPLLAHRRSPVVFDPTHELSRAELDLILEAARWSPSFGNTQPWRFAVATRGDDLHEKLLPLVSRGNQSWAPSASAILVLSTQMRQAPGEEKPPTGYSAYDAGQAAAHLTVQAQALGLGVHQFAGIDRPAVAEVLGLPAEDDVLVGIAIGRWWERKERGELDEKLLAREQRPRARRGTHEFVTWSRTPRLRDER